MPPEPPRVFISYSHDSDEHKARVLGLADRLRDHGVDARVDQYVESPTQGWPLWMEDEIEAADFVLVVATETYDRRRRGREAKGRGTESAGRERSSRRRSTTRRCRTRGSSRWSWQPPTQPTFLSSSSR